MGQAGRGRAVSCDLAQHLGCHVDADDPAARCPQGVTRRRLSRTRLPSRPRPPGRPGWMGRSENGFAHPGERLPPPDPAVRRPTRGRLAEQERQAAGRCGSGRRRPGGPLPRGTYRGPRPGAPRAPRRARTPSVVRVWAVGRHGVSFVVCLLSWPRVRPGLVVVVQATVWPAPSASETSAPRRPSLGDSAATPVGGEDRRHSMRPVPGRRPGGASATAAGRRRGGAGDGARGRSRCRWPKRSARSIPRAVLSQSGRVGEVESMVAPFAETRVQ